jgi:hypothetical protein
LNQKLVWFATNDACVIVNNFEFTGGVDGGSTEIKVYD